MKPETPYYFQPKGKPGYPLPQKNAMAGLFWGSLPCLGFWALVVLAVWLATH